MYNQEVAEKFVVDCIVSGVEPPVEIVDYVAVYREYHEVRAELVSCPASFDRSFNELYDRMVLIILHKNS